MKIFISWSGPRSNACAGALNDWLPNVIQSVKPFYSPDMDRGINWINRILKELAESSFGIICVTPSNEDSRWVNFEAGAIAKGIADAQAHVVPIALGFERVSDLDLPLSAFNAMGSSRADFYGLVKTINSNSANTTRLGEKRLDEVFDTWWPKLEAAIAMALAAHPEEPKTVKEDDKLDQILTAIRDLARRPSDEPDIETLVAKYGGYPAGTPLVDMLIPANLNRLVGQSNPAELRLRIAQKALELTLRDMSLGHLERKFHLSWLEPNLTTVIVPEEIFLDDNVLNSFQAIFSDRVGGEITFRRAGNTVAGMLSNLEIIKETLGRTLTHFGLPDVALRASHFNSEEIEIIEPHSLSIAVHEKLAENLFSVFPSVRLIKIIRSDGEAVNQVERPAEPE